NNGRRLQRRWLTSGESTSRICAGCYQPLRNSAESGGDGVNRFFNTKTLLPPGLPPQQQIHINEISSVFCAYTLCNNDDLK
ncbi:MAG: hypothetical protein JJU24_19280, partial [Natronohydrobacter sp.]|nr:hypothetical protein [Natronohydrobacter sp.]